MSTYVDITLDGGPADKNPARIRGDCVNLCVPFQYARKVGDTLVWLTAVYYPDGARSAKFSRIIQWADEPHVTPLDVTLAVDMARTVGSDGTLLELGCGASSFWLERETNVISIEDNPDFYGKFTPWHKNIYCPRRGQFYDPEHLERLLAGVTYDAILVDGPDGEERLKHWNEWKRLFNTDVHVYFDDYALLDFKDSIHKFADSVQRPLEIHDDCHKHWAVVRHA